MSIIFDIVSVCVGLVVCVYYVASLLAGIQFWLVVIPAMLLKMCRKIRAEMREAK